ADTACELFRRTCMRRACSLFRFMQGSLGLCCTNSRNCFKSGSGTDDGSVLQKTAAGRRQVFLHFASTHKMRSSIVDLAGILKIRPIKISQNNSSKVGRKKKRHAEACLLLEGCVWRLPGGESEFVDVDRVRCLVVVAVDLVVDGHAVPTGGRWCVIAVERSGVAVQRDGLEQQMSIRSALHLDGQVVPGVALRIARNPAGHPFLLAVIPRIPLVTAVDPAFVTPDIGLATHKLVDVKLQPL